MSNFSKPKILKSILAIVVVFLMSAGAFMGAAENGSIPDESKDVEALLPSISVAEPTFEDQEERIEDVDGIESLEPVHIEPGMEGVDPIVPEIGAEVDSEAFPDVSFDLNGMIVETNPMDQNIIPDDVALGSTQNSLSDAMSYITDKIDETDDTTTNNEIDDAAAGVESSARSRAGPLKIVLGTHNTQYAGNGQGYLYRSGTTYRAYDQYAMYNYQSGTSFEYHGFAVYNLRDLAKYDGVKITSGQIVYQQDYRYYAASQDFWTMKSIPYDGATGTTAQTWYNEVGGTGSVKLASETFNSNTNSNNFRHTLPITTAGITEINNRLSSSSYDFAIGGDITSFRTGYTYGYIYCLDTRLYLNFTYTDMPDDTPNQVAVGDELSGYAYSTSMYDIGRIYSSTSAGGYAVWNTSMIKSLLPSKGPEGEPIELTGISVQVNCVYGYYSFVSVYDMSNDPRTSTASTIYSDARGGTRYFYYSKSGSYVSTPREFTWDLGADALDDFNDTLDGKPDFFALGFTQTSNYMYLYSPMLIIKWRIIYPPTETLQLGADNPERGGHAMGYVRTTSSSTSYYGYSNYYAYPYYYKSTSTTNPYWSEYRGWTEFDLVDLTRWPGVKVKKAQLVIRNEYMRYFDTVNFTALKTTMYEGASSTTLAAVFNEAGPSGNIIGGYKLSVSSDNTPKDVVIDLNKAAVTALNSKLTGSPTYYTFGVGMYINGLQTGYSSAYARMKDVRLVVTFEFDSDMDPTKAGNGIAFGDDLSGYVYKYTSATDYPIGHMRLVKYTTSEYRGYATWDISKIASVFPEENFSKVEIKKVAVRFNHYSGSPSSINIYNMKYNASDSSLTDDNLFTDCGDGTLYYGPSTGSSASDIELEWDLGKDAVKDFQAAFEDNDPTFFGLGFTHTVSSSIYEFSPKLVLEWRIPPPGVRVELADETPEGFEASPVFFDASPSKNVSGGNGSLRFEWDWDNDGKFDKVSTSPLAEHTWPDDYVGNITLRVNDTDTGKNSSLEFTVVVHNEHPGVDTTKGSISPQPVNEAETVTFKGYTVVDPAKGYDKYWYFWDFNGDGVYDVNGSCNGTLIPEEVWYYDDDFQGEASLLVIDEDGGSSNITIPKYYEALPPTAYPYGTGYVYSSSQSYLVYPGNVWAEWQYSADYIRGWAKFDLSGMEMGGVVDKVVFTGMITQDTNVDLVGVRYMETDPSTSIYASSKDSFDEAGFGPKIFDITWKAGAVRVDLTPLLTSPAAKTVLDEIAATRTIILGFDYEKPDPSFARNYGWLSSYSSADPPTLKINYHLVEPRYLFPIIVKNQPPVVNCSDVIVSPTTINEGDNITVTNLSFCDKGNDTYEYNISVGDTYWTGWQPLGERPIPGIGGISTENIAPDASPSSSGGGSGTYGPASMNDLNLNNMCWISASSSTPNAFFQLTWSKKHMIAKMEVIQHGAWSNSGNRNLAGCDVQYHDGSKWVTDGTLSGLNSDFEYTFKQPRNTDRIRMTNVKVTGTQASNPCVYEWYVYEGGGAGLKTIEDFETGTGWPWKPWVQYSTSGSVGTSYAHDGKYGFLGSSGWYYRTDVTIGKKGERLEWWSHTGTGRSYLGFGATSSGCWSFVCAPNTGNIIFQANSGYSYSDLASSSVSWTTGKWYKAEVVFEDDAGSVTGNLYDSDGKKLIATVKTKISGFKAGGVAMRGFGNFWMDTIKGGVPGGEGFKGWGAYGAGCHNVTMSLNFTIPDDYPFMGTTQDELNVTVWVRDDDHNTFVPGRGIGPIEDAAMVDSGYVYYNNGRKVVVDKDYNLYVCYQKYITTPAYSYQIYVAKSEDNGENWEPHLVTNQWYHTYYSYYPSITIDSKGVLHVVYSGGTAVSTAYNVRYARSEDGGVTWIDHYNITSATSYYHYYPSIACDEDDKIHVVWYGRDNATYYNNIHYINRSSDGVWGKRVMLTTWLYVSPYMYTNHASVETDSKGNVHVVWWGYIETTKTYYNIGYRVHWAVNDTWSPIIPLTSDTGYYKYYPVVTADANDDIHVVWYGTDAQRPGTNFVYMMYDSSTKTWGSREYLTNATNQAYGTIGINKKGEVDAIWSGYKLPEVLYPYVIHHGQKTTTGWTEDYNFYVSAAYNYYPNMMYSPPNAIAEEGFAFVWYDGTVRYWTSRDFRMGNPEYLNGLGWCNRTVLVKNVEPKLNLSALGKMGYAYEQMDYELFIMFDDPAIGVKTEIFEYKIDWGDGTVDDWTAGKSYPVESLLAGRNPETGIAGTVLKEEYSFNEKPITYLAFEYFQPTYPYYWYINIEGYNMTTKAWEQLFYHYDMYPPSTGKFEQSWSTPYYTRWRVEASCYNYAQYTGYYEFEYMVEDFNLTGGYIIASHMYPDDMPTGTPWDMKDIKIELREDDLGYDKGEFVINVSSVAPTVKVGDITPDVSEGINEGTHVNLDYFSFNDVAFDEPTETFEYQLDWGDGTVDAWKSDFTFASTGGEIHIVEKNQGYSSATAMNSQRNMVMDSKGNFYVVSYHYDSTVTFYTQIFCSISKDLGESWETYKVTTPSKFQGVYQYYPSIAIDSNDMLHIAWTAQVTGNTYQQVWYTNSMDGKTWTNFTEIAPGFYFSSSVYYEYMYSRYPVISIDSSDVVHIAWETYGYYYNYTTFARRYTYAINYTYSTATGWSTPFNIDAWIGTGFPYLYQWRPTIAVDELDNLHVAWYGYNTGNTARYNIRYRMYNASSSKWEAKTAVTNSTSNYNYYPCITTDIYNNVHLVWYGYPTPTRIWYTKLDNSTKSWGTAQVLSEIGQYSYQPTVGTDERGYVYASWYGYPYPYKIYITVDKGSGFEKPLVITSDLKFQYQYYPSIMGHESSRALRGAAVVWSGYVEGRYDTMFYATDDFFIGKGPLRGIPGKEHLFNDDKPSATMEDLYKLTIRVRDDDLAVGEHVIPIIVRNVWPTLEKDGLSLVLSDDESMLYTPEIDFVDPGTGPTETWNYWLDVDDSETMTEHDLTGAVTTTTVIDNVTYGTIPPIKTPFNDEYMGTIGLYLYDDDIPSVSMHMNYTEKVTGSAEVFNAETNMYTSSATAYNNGRNMVVDSKGNLYLVTCHRGTTTRYDIWCSVSQDMGETWTRYEVTKDTASNNQYQYYPSVAIDSNDILHVVWHAYYPVSSPFSPRYSVRYANSSDGGKTWGNFNVIALGQYRSRTRITGNDYYYYNYEENPSMAIDDNDVVHVTWRHYLYKYNYTSSSRTYEYGIKYANNSGGSFGTPTDVVFWTGSTSPYLYQYAPSISVDTMNNVHIAWYGYHSSASTSTYNILYRKLDALSGWDSITPITAETSSTYAGYRPCITADKSDNVHVVWYQRISGGSYYEIRYRMYDSSTSSWGAIEDVTSGSSYYQYYPSVGTDARGHIYVAWHGGTAYPYKIYMTKKNPIIGTWGEPELITDDPSIYTSAQYYSSTMDFNSNGFPYEGMGIAWGGYVSGRYNTMFFSTDDFFAGLRVEKTDFKVKFDVTLKNVPPVIIMPDNVEFLPDERIKLPIHLSDQGSDDLYFTIDWGDVGGATGPLEVHKWYNNDIWPEPGYDTTTGKIHSALNGTAPFMVDPELYHRYLMPGKFMINMTVWDDDEWNWGEVGTNYSLPVEVLTPYRMKEVAVRELEKLLPGRLGYVGYDSLELKYVGVIDPTLLVYNHISRPPFYWETKLLMSQCNVKTNTTIFIDASFLDEGMFGDKVILKLYNDCSGGNRSLLDVTEIPTVYTCLEPLKINQRYGNYVVTNFTRKEGMSYHHYSQFALKTEDALDHVLRSINRDPRRGYGWWHQYWAWWCGYTFYRGLWVDDMRVDPQFGLVVFSEERAAVLDLMEVLKNCLDPKGVSEITFKYNGGTYGCSKVDVEIYFLSDFWWGGWQWYDAAYDLPLGESFTINASGLSSGMLPDRVMMRIYHSTSGKLLDTIYIRTSGEWFLEVEPGNLYGDFEITSSTLILGDDSEWDTWWGGDSDWWDWFFGFWYWEDEDFRSSGCGWEPDDCYDKDAAREEQKRLCSNLTIIKQIINMLVKADDMLARAAYYDAENATVLNAENEDEYMYHYKWSKRYWYRGYDNYKKGRPHRAITDFKKAWKHAILATKWANKNPIDPTPGGDMADPVNEDCMPVDECGNPQYEPRIKQPWWMWWYFSWCTCRSFCNTKLETCCS